MARDPKVADPDSFCAFPLPASAAAPRQNDLTPNRILFSGWVILSEHKRVNSGERRSNTHTIAIGDVYWNLAALQSLLDVVLSELELVEAVGALLK